MTEIAVALVARACTVAMAAKAGKLTDRHRLQLLRDVLVFVPDDAGWRAAVLAFEQRLVDGRVLEGARELHDYALGAGSVAVTALGLDETLARIEAESLAHYDWMDRRDING